MILRSFVKTAYRDIFINYTAGFVFVTIVVFVVKIVREKSRSMER